MILPRPKVEERDVVNIFIHTYPEAVVCMKAYKDKTRYISWGMPAFEQEAYDHTLCIFPLTVNQLTYLAEDPKMYIV